MHSKGSLWKVLAFLSAFPFCSPVTGLQIIAGTTSSFTTLHSQQHLVVAVHPADHLWDAGEAAAVRAARPQLMKDTDGTQYMCYVPDPINRQRATATTGEVAKQTFPPPDTRPPFKLLERLSTLCLYRQEGLWTYEVCYKKHARQFRQPSGSEKGEDFSCGEYTGDEAQSEEIKVDKASPEDAQLRYVSHNMTRGAACALSGANRTSEVRFMCMRDMRDNMITSVREFPTCNYIFTVATPLLCRHPQFKPPDEVTRTVHCKVVQDSSEQGNTEADKEELQAAPSPPQAHAADTQQDSSMQAAKDKEDEHDEATKKEAPQGSSIEQDKHTTTGSLQNDGAHAHALKGSASSSEQDENAAKSALQGGAHQAQALEQGEGTDPQEHEDKGHSSDTAASLHEEL